MLAFLCTEKVCKKKCLFNQIMPKNASIIGKGLAETQSRDAPPLPTPPGLTLIGVLRWKVRDAGQICKLNYLGILQIKRRGQLKWILVLSHRQRHFCQSVTDGYVFKNLGAKQKVISYLICLQICRCKVTFLSKHFVEISYCNTDRNIKFLNT